MSKDVIEVRGAEEHNLKDVDVEIPREELTVVTGLSGSGKSSLAFETIYAEGQRRYIESLSAYARNFLGQMDKPQVENVEGLSPNSTTTSDCCTPGSARPTARSVAARWASSRPRTWSTGSSNSPKGRGRRSPRRWSAIRKGPSRTCSTNS
jgi:excinuclease UvrABC ATPase subunit